jgi:hypothetical protein
VWALAFPSYDAHRAGSSSTASSSSATAGGGPAGAAGGRYVYNIVLDAGSTGSRVHVFKFERGEGKGAGALKLISDTFEQLKPGLSAYRDDPSAAAASLKPLLTTALRAVPKELQAGTGLSLKATAGLRLLPGSKADDILKVRRRRGGTAQQRRAGARGGAVVSNRRAPPGRRFGVRERLSPVARARARRPSPPPAPHPSPTAPAPPQAVREYLKSYPFKVATDGVGIMDGARGQGAGRSRGPAGRRSGCRRGSCLESPKGALISPPTALSAQRVAPSAALPTPPRPSGAHEGAYAWLTLNYLLGKLGNGPEGTVAAIDLGGGSVQEAFALPDAEAAAAPAGYVTTLRAGGSAYKVYVHR